MKAKSIIAWAVALLCVPVAGKAQYLGNMSKEEMAVRKLTMAQLAINSLYVDSVDVLKLSEDAINGMLSRLDPHSAYTNAEDTKRLNEPLKGNFEGIGVQFNMLEDTLVVIQPLTKGPSEKVGILAGDRIVAVNDTAIAGVKMHREEIVRRLRGPKNSKVKLTVVRQGVPGTTDFIVERDKIPVNTLDAAFMIDKHTGLIRLSSFGATSHQELVEALKSLKAQGMRNLIFDLQQNGGGYLDAATKIAGEFLHDDDMIVYTQGSRTPRKEYHAKGTGMFREGKLVVLIDEYSASASEIVTGAIQDHDRGYVVGRRSFGKGLVQRPLMLPDASMIRLTVARYFTPAGRCIQKPYVKGDRLSYEKDVIDRFNNGELTHADSIHFPDSLRYKTLVKGRTVYGGGGIMPDYFVPLDTTRYSLYHRSLSAKGAIISTNLKYIDGHRARLKAQYPTFDSFKKDYEVTDDMLALLRAEGEKKNVKPKDEAEWKASLPMLKLTLKALVARDLWDMSEYFAIIYPEDPVVKKALELIPRPATSGLWEAEP